MRSAVRRLVRGKDLKRSLAELMESSGFSSAIIGSVVGSLTQAHLRAAGAEKTLDISGPLEIVAATGTLGPTAMHVHVAVSDVNGSTFGGHLLEGCIVSSTVEVVLIELPEWQFARQIDPSTGYQELVATRTEP